MTQAPRRKRDSAATKDALLQAASALFAERGFNATTVRDVAARAGVNQALLFRYFGSKQELFAAVLSHDSTRLLEAQPPEELPLRILGNLLSADQLSGPEHPIAAMLRSYSDERAAHVLREELGARYAARLAELTDAPDAELRADLVLAWLFGIGMVRSVLGKSPLADADPDAVARHVARGISVLLERTDLPDER
ncbi:TetR/AcrR family transcriptional regulator [Saccharopolyspora elongata]|uniref:TetR/AcrR family transcriptional regulator n=1 Tax=Saccharopolyspora elongata TaxID=2530387 RepID=A0A4V2YKV4_9PSEU|nr:TetR family transcriptional regulator [Saccharopolyspora elongata]TDD43917.1 TetR/AcrR family transcriptional regulator [Saccharopolyspora elongata]